ncbi:MAG: patatin-like phospholipase family protein [Xanthomonadales bacterium]|nr:patatin-like phospholipase family protein [Xanthomonadales bacterium]
MRTVSLVLGAGGARGLAHIGVIEELEAFGFRIASIAGASMGALVGGIHAAGALAAYRDWVLTLERLDVLRLLDFSFRGAGMIRGERIMARLRELVGERRIEELPIAFTAVAVDVDAEREVWLSRGSLFDAIRASIAIPGIFTPDGARGTPSGGRRTAQPGAGGAHAARPQPAHHRGQRQRRAPPAGAAAGRRPRAAPVAAEPAGLLARVGLRRRRRRQQGTLELLARSLDLMMQSITRHRLASHHPHLLIEVPREAASFYEFWRARELIERGRQAARAALAALPEGG